MTNSTQEPSTTNDQPTPDTALQRVWTELERSTEGVSLTVYEEYDDETVAVRDEMWWTWGEFTGMETQDPNISRRGVTQMGIIGQDEVSESDGKLLE